MKNYEHSINFTVKTIQTEEEDVKIYFYMSNVKICGIDIPNEEFEKLIIEYNRRIQELENLNK